MDNPDLANDVRYLRDVVERTMPPSGVNRHWPITLGWGVVITIGYAICAFLGATGRTRIIPWVWPALICLVAWPLWYLRRRVRQGMEQGGRRPRSRRELTLLWSGIAVMGLLSTAWVISSGLVVDRWYLIPFVWCALNFVGYVMNGILISNEWYWAAGVLLVSMVVTGIAGPHFYWICAVWIPATLLIPGLIGYFHARRQTVQA